jgi:hypothetical protein
MGHCCVVFCHNNWRNKDKYLSETGKELHFHEFPTDRLRRKEWLIAIRRDVGNNFQVRPDTFPIDIKQPLIEEAEVYTLIVMVEIEL